MVSDALVFNGSAAELSASLSEIDSACQKSPAIAIGNLISSGYAQSPVSFVEHLKLKDFDLDNSVSAKLIQFFQIHSKTLKSLTLYECSGHIDLLLVVALTSLKSLETLTICTGRTSEAAFDPCANALGVAFQSNQSLRSLSLRAASNVFFTLSASAATSFADGLSGNCMLEHLELVGCRFAGPSAIQHLAHGLRRHCFLKRVRLQSLFHSNGHVLGDASLAELLLALGQHNSQLKSLELIGNECLDGSIMAVSMLLDRTALESLDISHSFNWVPPYDRQNGNGDVFMQEMNLSLLVAAIGRNNSLRSLELQFNHLGDSAMAYLAAALSHNTSIRYLGLGNNQISNVGVSILASTVPQMHGLKRLNLAHNDIDNQGLSELALAMKENLCLESVKLDVGYSNAECQIHFLADLNRIGRRHLPTDISHLPLACLPFILARVNRAPTRGRQVALFYSLLHDFAILFPR